MLSVQSVFAQYGQNLRYNGQNEVLYLDVFEPAGDTETQRPLIIFACGGNFLSSDKTQMDVVPLCRDLAKMGYVTASINYRVGMPGIPFPGPDSVDASQAVLRGTQDSRAAVRFFRRDVAEWGNRFGIDTNLIFFGGSSAGGFNALHLAYLDDVNEIPFWLDTTANGCGGGIAGNTGNLGYSSKVSAIINIAGALGDTAWMKSGDTPVLSFHGDQDGVVPFGTDMIYLLGTFPIMVVDGSESVHIKADAVGINNCFKPFWGADHTPHWSNPPDDVFYYDTTLTMIKHFLLQFVCGAPPICDYIVPDSTYLTNCSSGRYWSQIFPSFDLTSDVTSNVPFRSTAGFVFRIYPNPAKDMVEVLIENQSASYRIELYDYTGKLLRAYHNLSEKSFNLQRGDLPSGFYLLKVSTEDAISTQKLIFE